MTSFSERLAHEMNEQGISQAELCRRTGLKSGHISPYLTSKTDRDPRISTVAKIANALDVSVDYLAGLTDNPSGFTEEELKQFRIDADIKALIFKYSQLPPERKEIIQETVDFQLSKSKAEGTSERVDYDQIIGVA